MSKTQGPFLRVLIQSYQGKPPVAASVVKKTLHQLLRAEKAKGELSVAFVDDREISRLNETYRNKKGPTDVLAFPSDSPLLGDIVIAVPTALRQAKMYGHSALREILFLLVHGALHLLGYDHHTPRERKKMFKKQEDFLKKLLLKKNG